jgi:hypothetical protein
MTWSLKPHGIRTEPPHVLWSDTFLRNLSDDDFRAAIRAAEAMGDDVYESIGTPDQQPLGSIGKAKLIVGAVIGEMTRRGWQDSGGEKKAETGYSFDDVRSVGPIGEAK